MKKYIFLILSFALCVLSSCSSEKDPSAELEQEIEKAISLSIQNDVPTPKTLTIESYMYGVAPTIYSADPHIWEDSIMIKTYQKKLSESKNSADRNYYKGLINIYDKSIKEYIDLFYPNKKEYIKDGTKYTTVPVIAYTVIVNYSYINIYGTRVEDKQYFNVVQSKTTCVSETDTIEFFSFNAFDSEIYLMSIGEMKFVAKH